MITIATIIPCHDQPRRLDWVLSALERQLAPNDRIVVVDDHSRTPLPALIEHWIVCHERFADDRRYLNRLLTLTYEELVATPDACVERIHGFLQVPHTPRGQQVETTVNRKYFERWRETLKNQSGAKVKEFLQRMEPRVNRFGYSLLELDRLTPLDADFSRPG